MTEFALIVPVFMLIVVGMLVFGRLFFYWIETNHVANETARWAVVDRNPYDLCPRPSPDSRLQSLQQHARSSATNEFEDNAAVCIDFPGKDSGRRRRRAVGDPCESGFRCPSLREVLRLGRHDQGPRRCASSSIGDDATIRVPDRRRTRNENIGTCS